MSVKIQTVWLCLQIPCPYYLQRHHGPWRGQKKAHWWKNSRVFLLTEIFIINKQNIPLHHLVLVNANIPHPTSVPSCDALPSAERRIDFIRYFHIPIIHVVYPPKVLHKHCFHFLLGFTIFPRELENNTYAKFWEANKVYYGLCESSEFTISAIFAPACGLMR